MNPLRDFCDECTHDLPDYTPAWFIKTGETDTETGLPVVTLMCSDCYKNAPVFEP